MWTYGTQTELPALTGDVYGHTIGPGIEGFTDIRTREYAVLRALGLVGMTIPEAIEVAANWIVVGFITLGAGLLVAFGRAETEFKIMAVALWGLIIATVAIPWLSQFYGGMRVYFTALPVLAIGLPVGVKWIADRVKIKPIVLCGLVLALLAVSTSGLVYKPFGEVKTFPVYWQVEDLEVRE